MWAPALARRDRPVITTEVHFNETAPVDDLLAFLRGLGYASYALCAERCGARSDCRNLLNLPTSRVDELLGRQARARASRVVATKRGHEGGAGHLGLEAWLRSGALRPVTGAAGFEGC